jgi:4-amino-4-deoxy-L-arabinose transferase-like glycosyltransferase
MAGLVVVTLAIVLRVGWVFLVPTRPVGDFAMYWESAAHLVEFGSFDPEYVYMPGYIFLLAPVRAMGGGWLAAKLVGAILGGLAAGAVYGIARRIWGEPEALVAGLLCALWPAGISLASVTGTDMPAAALIVIAIWALLRLSPARPFLAAVLFGLVMGLATYIRAIALPLTVLAVLPLRASGVPWRRALRATALACVVCALMLAPWAVRNRLRYGETFATDSHGGLTALVGANPNTDGCYSRSLNLIFREVTGFTLLAEPHREADHAALRIARQWTTFDPAFSAGLVVAKAERLLSYERALLYWPLFRVGVLPPGQAGWFARHRTAIETMADSYWSVLLAAASVGVVLALRRRRWLALTLLPLAAGLAVLYALIFAEQRYRLPISLLVMVLAGGGVIGAGQLVRACFCRPVSPGTRREAVLALSVVAGLFAVGRAMIWVGSELRDRNRWAVHVCDVNGNRQLCAWRAVKHAGASGLRGVVDGVGVPLPGNGQIITETEMNVAAGEYALSAAAQLVPGAPASGTLELASAGMARPVVQPLPALAAATAPVPFSTTIQHAGGPLRLQMRLAATSPRAGRVWLSDLHLTRL